MALVGKDVLKALVVSDDYKPNEVSYRTLSDRLDEDSTKVCVFLNTEGANNIRITLLAA